MKLTKWDPLREMEDIFDRYGRCLSWPRRGSQETMATGDWAPRVDISETAKECNIKVEIPEVKKDDVKVTVENGVLTIRGERKQEKEEKDEKFHRIERSYGSFTRSFTLPDNAAIPAPDARRECGLDLAGRFRLRCRPEREPLAVQGALVDLRPRGLSAVPLALAELAQWEFAAERRRRLGRSGEFPNRRWGLRRRDGRGYDYGSLAAEKALNDPARSPAPVSTTCMNHRRGRESQASSGSSRHRSDPPFFPIRKTRQV